MTWSGCCTAETHRGHSSRIDWRPERGHSTTGSGGHDGPGPPECCTPAAWQLQHVTNGKAHLTHHVTSPHDSTCLKCRDHALWLCRACQTARHDMLDMSNVSCRDVRSQVELGLKGHVPITRHLADLMHTANWRQVKLLCFQHVFRKGLIYNNNNNNNTKFIKCHNAVIYLKWTDCEVCLNAANMACRVCRVEVELVESEHHSHYNLSL